MEETLRLPPTLAEFEEAIQKSKSNSSAGMTGVSYNMLKKLPAVLVSRLHYCLARLWTSGATPDWWKEKWLVPIPKKHHEVTNVANLRPLILVDAIRKIWCKLILRRMQAIWRKHDILKRTQHGFLCWAQHNDGLLLIH